MSSRKLRRLHLSSKIQTQLEAHNIQTAKDLFKKNETELVAELDITAIEVSELFSVVCDAICPGPKTAFELWNTQKASDNSLYVFQNLVSSRVPAGSITELVGPAGAGKSQCCMMLSVLATLSDDSTGTKGGVVYIDTEGTFSPSRLVEIAESRFPDRFTSPESLRSLMSSVIVYQDTSTDKLLNRFKSLEPVIIEKTIKLIIVDSIAAPVRIKYDRDHFLQRQNMLSDLAATMKFLAEQFNLPVVVTNQVTTKFNPQISSVVSSGESSDSKLFDAPSLSAALGVAWAHSVNTRFSLQDCATRKVFTVAKSPLVPVSSHNFQITAAGLQLVEDAPGILSYNDLDVDDTSTMAKKAKHPANST